MKKFFGLFAIFLLSATMFSGLASAADEDVVINEFNHYGSADWIELYNDGNTDVDLSDWTVQDGISTIKLLTGSIGAKGYAVFTWNKLNNLGDLIEIINGDGDTIDIVAYGNFDDGDMSDNAPAITINGNSVGRSPNGADTGTDNVDFVIFTTPTKGFSNGVIDDDEEPVLENVEVNPDSVNVDAGPATVTVTLEISDDSPIEWIDVNLESQDYDQQFWSNGVFEYNSVNDEYNVEMEIPQYSADGIWMVDRVWIADTFGNNKNFDEDDFGSVTFEVESSTPDLEAPVLDIDSIEFDPASANEGETVTLIFEASDAVSGIKLNDCHVCIRDAGFDYSDCEDVKAGADTGTYEAEFEVDTDEELTIYLHNIGLVDNVGNWISYDYFSFETISFRANPSGNYGVSLSDPADQTVDVGEEYDYTITVTNTGDAEDTFDLTLSTTVEPLDTLKLSATSVDLEAGEDDEITLTVGSDTAGTYEVDVIATSQGDTSKTATVTIETTFEVPTNDFTISPIGAITAEADDDAASVIEKTFTVDSGDSGVNEVYFTADDLQLSWTDDSDGAISADNIKFYRADGTQITPTSKLHLSSEKVTVNVKITIPDDSSMDFYGLYASQIHVKGSAGTDVAVTDINININPIEWNSLGKYLEIDNDFEIPDNDFYRGNEVTVTLTIDNNYDEDVEDIIVTLINPELDLKEDSEKFSLDKNENTDIEFTFEIPSDVAQGKYKLYAFIEGEDSDDSSNNLYNFQVSSDKVEVYVEAHHLRSEFDLEKDTYKAGETIKGKLKLYNAGKNDEDNIIVRVYSDELGYSTNFQFNSLNDGKSKTIDLSIPVSKNAENGAAEISAEIKYDDYEDQADDDDVDGDLQESVFVTITDGTAGGEGDAEISGVTSGTADAGIAKKFSLNLENTGDGSETFTIEVEDYSDWADARVEPEELTIPAGTDVPFYVYITPNSGVSGSKTATVAAYVGSEQVASKMLTVTVGGSDIVVSDLGNRITGAFAGEGLDTSLAIVISSVVAGVVILAGIYMFTLRREF